MVNLKNTIENNAVHISFIRGEMQKKKEYNEK